MPSDTKTALLDSAERVVRRRGFDAFSYADLAAEVGIRKASIHHHFPSKAKLSIALMERYHGELERVRAEVNESTPTGAGRLEALIDHYRSALEGGHRLCLCVAFSISRESLSDQVIILLGKFRTLILDWIKTIFELGHVDGTISQVQDAKREAAALLPLLEGAQLTARTDQNPALFEDAIALLVDRIR